MKLRHNLHRRASGVAVTNYMSIDRIGAKEIDPEIGSKCLKPWILNGEPMMNLCTDRLRSDRRPWCSTGGHEMTSFLTFYQTKCKNEKNC